MLRALRSLQHSRSVAKSLAPAKALFSAPSAPQYSRTLAGLGASTRRHAYSVQATIPAADASQDDATKLVRPVVGPSFQSKYARGEDAGPRLAKHLNEVFKPLEFPPDLATRMLTHLSHRDSVRGHNARLAFLGRRTAETYLLLWLHSLPPELANKYDYDRTVARTLNTYVLGEHVAPRWGVTRVMRWSSNVAEVEEGEVPEGGAIETGLFKVAGAAVEAVLGGIYHQFGGSVAHRVFHTRLFPYILQPGTPIGLPDTLLSHARESIDKMGGLKGPLVPSPMYTR